MRQRTKDERLRDCLDTSVKLYLSRHSYKQAENGVKVVNRQKVSNSWPQLLSFSLTTRSPGAIIYSMRLKLVVAASSLVTFATSHACLSPACMKTVYSFGFGENRYKLPALSETFEGNLLLAFFALFAISLFFFGKQVFKTGWKVQDLTPSRLPLLPTASAVASGLVMLLLLAANWSRECLEWSRLF